MIATYFVPYSKPFIVDSCCMHQWIRSNCTMHSFLKSPSGDQRNNKTYFFKFRIQLFSSHSRFNYSLCIQDSIILFTSRIASKLPCQQARADSEGLPRGQMAEFFPGKRFKNGFLGDFSSFDFFIFLFHYDEAYLINF